MHPQAGELIHYLLGVKMTTCTRCENSGFINLHQIPDAEYEHILLKYDDLSSDWSNAIQVWIDAHGDHDVQVCDCCGDGEDWYGVPGEHYNTEDPRGHEGPYAYNGGLCECN